MSVQTTRRCAAGEIAVARSNDRVDTQWLAQNCVYHHDTKTAHMPMFTRLS